MHFESEKKKKEEEEEGRMGLFTSAVKVRFGLSFSRGDMGE